MADLIEIISKFDTKCGKCGKTIARGSVVKWDRPARKVYCENCDMTNDDTIVVEQSTNTAEVKIDKVKVQKIVNKMVTQFVNKSVKDIKDSVGGDIKAIANEAETQITLAKKRVVDELTAEFGEIPKRIITIEKEGKSPKKIKEITHEKFPDIVTMVTADVPVFLRGEAGCGKNHMVKQIADALDLDFYFSNAITNEYKVTGFIDANGNFHTTQFFDAFTKGGLFFFDEIDASIPEVLVLLNAAIENKYFNFPHGKFDAHPEFRIIAAGNTFGSGANQTYVGRYQLDGASLDRFAVVDITYDEQVERIIANGDVELVDAIHALRKITEEAGIKIILSYRAINQITKLHTVKNLPVADVMRYVILKGMHVDDMNIIKPKIENNHNKYLKALAEVMV